MDFIQFAESHGLIVPSLIEGRWVRVKTEDKRTKRNGAYLYKGDFGAVQNWATMEHVAIWRPDGRSKIDRAEFRQRRRTHQIDEAARQQAAARRAAEMIKECTYQAHPYLQKKGFTKPGLVHPSGDLIVPMLDLEQYPKVFSAQRIAPDGTKLFLPGGKTKGAVYRMGTPGESWLVEGFATGLSVQAALAQLRRRAAVVVCFSAGNLAHVATLLRGKAYVVADNDPTVCERHRREGVAEPLDPRQERPEWCGCNPGVTFGLRAATALHAPLVVPDVGDFNDFHQQRGLRAAVDLIRSVI